MINIETILGKRGHHWIRNLYEKFQKSVLIPMLVKREVRDTLDQSNLVRAAQAMAQKDVAQFEEFAHEVTAWYESTRSRTATMTSMDDGTLTVPNGHPKTGEHARFVDPLLEESPRSRATSAYAPASILR